MALAYAVSQAHGELSAQATMDSLTGLANRAAFTDALTAALESDATYTSVLFIDLDDFKDVNDRFGHRAGDEALRDVADRLRRATRASDLCARLGGDEFAVLLPDADETVAADAAHRVAVAIGTQMRRDRDVVRVGASVGAATAPAHSDPELLLHRADAAMYEAKTNRKRMDQRVGPGPRAVEISPRSAG
jgi:diguanylate cyclase (GGDEF)-like protein